jgi:hypothetical protein
MNRLSILLYCLFLADWASAGEQLLNIELKYGASRTVHSGFSIHFAAMVGDSRCPADRQCIWPGNARIELELSSGSDRESVHLNTFLHPRSARYHGFLITFEDLKPHLFSGQTAKEGDYTAVLSVK